MGLNHQPKQCLPKNKPGELLFYLFPLEYLLWKKIKAQTCAGKELLLSLCSVLNTPSTNPLLVLKAASLIPGECLRSLGGNSISGSWELANMYPEYLNAIMRRNRRCHPSWPSNKTPFFLLPPFVSFFFFFFFCVWVCACVYKYTPG